MVLASALMRASGQMTSPCWEHLLHGKKDSGEAPGLFTATILMETNPISQNLQRSLQWAMPL